MDNVHSKLEEFVLKIVRNIKMNCGLTYIAGIEILFMNMENYLYP